MNTSFLFAGWRVVGHELARGLLGLTLTTSVAWAQFAIQDHTTVYENTTRQLYDAYDSSATQPGEFGTSGSGTMVAHPDVSFTYDVATSFSHTSSTFSIELGVDNPQKHPSVGSSRDTRLDTNSRLLTGYFDGGTGSYKDPETVSFSGGMDPFSVTFAVAPTQFDYTVESTLSDSFEIMLSASYTLKQFSSGGGLKASTTIQYSRTANNANPFYGLDDSMTATTFNMVSGDYIEISSDLQADVTFTVFGHETSANTGGLDADLGIGLTITDLTAGMSYTASEGSTLSAVPEPSSYAMILAGFSFGAVMLRRPRRG